MVAVHSAEMCCYSEFGQLEENVGEGYHQVTLLIKRDVSNNMINVKHIGHVLLFQQT